MKKTILRVKLSELREEVQNVINEWIKSGRVNNYINERKCKRYYVNMSYPIAKPHRTAKKMSDDELRDKLTKLWYKCYDDVEYKDKPSQNLKKLFSDLVRAYRRGHKKNVKILSQFGKDIEKVKFDWENCDPIGDVEDYNGVKYLLFEVGGDWECNVAMFVYHDGNTLRGYIPIHGNAINLNGGEKRNEKVAFGNNDEADAEFCKSEGIEDSYSAIGYVVYNKDEVIKDFKNALKVSK